MWRTLKVAQPFWIFLGIVLVVAISAGCGRTVKIQVSKQESSEGPEGTVQTVYCEICNKDVIGPTEDHNSAVHGRSLPDLNYCDICQVMALSAEHVHGRDGESRAVVARDTYCFDCRRAAQQDPKGDPESNKIHKSHTHQKSEFCFTCNAEKARGNTGTRATHRHYKSIWCGTCKREAMGDFGYDIVLSDGKWNNAVQFKFLAPKVDKTRHRHNETQYCAVCTMEVALDFKGHIHGVTRYDSTVKEEVARYDHTEKSDQRGERKFCPVCRINAPESFGTVTVLNPDGEEEEIPLDHAHNYEEQHNKTNEDGASPAGEWNRTRDEVNRQIAEAEAQGRKAFQEAIEKAKALENAPE